MHIFVPDDWARKIDRAAKALKLSRSNFITRAAHEVAERELARLAAEKAAARQGD